MPNMAETVSDQVVGILLDWGVDTVFGLPGGGEVNRQRIGLSIGRHAVQEFTFSESPFGVAGRLVEKLTGQKGETEKE
jgi:hypothetical protein